MLDYFEAAKSFLIVSSSFNKLGPPYNEKIIKKKKRRETELHV